MRSVDKFRNQILLIDAVNRDKCNVLLDMNIERFLKSKGSLSKHHAWEGGYVDHLVETIDIAILFYKETNKIRRLPFSLGDVVLVIFLHDLEKPFKYVEPKTPFSSDSDKEVFIDMIIKKYRISLNDNHRNALKYIHGEGKDFSSTELVQSPLAAFCHICDTFSARIWFDYPAH